MWLAAVSFSLFAVLLSSEVVNAKSVDPTQSIKAIENVVKPALEQSTEWSLKAGLGLVSASAFYALVVRVIKL